MKTTSSANSNIKNIKIALLVAVALGLVACGQQQEAKKSANKQAAAAASQPVPKEKSLPPTLIYDLLAGEIAWDRNQPQISSQFYQRAAADSQDPYIADKATELALVINNTDAALQSAKIWANGAPDDYQAQNLVATLLLRKSSVQEAEIYLRRLVDANKPEAWAQLQDVVNRMHSLDEHASLYKALSTINITHKKDAKLLFFTAYAASLTGATDAANSKLAESLAMDPNDEGAIALKAKLLRDASQNAQAFKFIEDNLNRNANLPQVRWIYAQMLLEQNNPDKAYEQYQILTKSKDYAEQATLNLAEIDMLNKNYSHAEKILLSLVSDENPNDTVFQLLGQLKELQGDTDAALNWYSKIGPGPIYLGAQIKTTLLMAKRGEINQALTRLEVLGISFPDAAINLQLARAQILMDANRSKEAMGMLNAAVAKTPDNLDLRYSRAQAAGKLHDLPTAEADLKYILAKQPENVDALNALGYTLTNLSARYQEAETYIQKALKLAPNSPAIEDSLGWVQIHLGQLDQAIKNLQQAYQMDPDPEIAAHLGEALWKKGASSEANNIWNKALETSPKHTILLDTIKRNRK